MRVPIVVAIELPVHVGKTNQNILQQGVIDEKWVACQVKSPCSVRRIWLTASGHPAHSSRQSPVQRTAKISKTQIDPGLLKTRIDVRIRLSIGMIKAD